MYILWTDLAKMEAHNRCGSSGDLCLPMVELSLAQSSLSACESGEIAGVGFGGCRDAQHADVGQLLDLEIDDDDVRGKYDPDHPQSVTHSTRYVTGQHAASFDDYLQQTNSLLDFDLDCLSAIDQGQTFTDATLTDPLPALSVSNTGDHLHLDSVGAMPSSEVRTNVCTSVADKIGQRKKAIPRRRGQQANIKPNTIPPVPMMNPGVEKPLDDFARLVDYVPECLERFGFCVVDKFAGKSLALSVRSEVLTLYEQGSFEDGLLTNQAFALTAVRGDRVCWLESEGDAQCAGICELICRLDDLFLRLRGCLGSCHISSRSKVSHTHIFNKMKKNKYFGCRPQALYLNLTT